MNLEKKSFWIGFVTASIIILPTVVVLFSKLDEMFYLK